MVSQPSKLRCVVVLFSLATAGCNCEPPPGTTVGTDGGNGGGNSAATGGGSGGAGGTGVTGGGPGGDPTRLFFDPAEVTVVLDGTGSSKQATFQLMAEYANGTTTPISAPVVNFDRPDLATMTPGSPVVATCAGMFGGVATITAVKGSLRAVARLIVKQVVAQVDPGVSLAAADALRAPTLPQDPALTGLLYPYNATVFPLGLTSPLLMWDAVQANDVYLLRMERSNYRFDLFFVGTVPGRVRAAQARWDQVTTSNDPSDPLKVSLRRYDVATSTAYSSASQAWTITSKSLRGAIYYWTTSGTGHLARIRPGSGSTPESLANGQCMGCHAVSADGTRLVAAVEDATSNDTPGFSTRAWVSYDLPAATEASRTQFFGGNLALNPNGKYVVYGSKPLKLGDAATGQRIANSGLETLPLESGMVTHAHPAFSPDGTRLATVQSSNVWYVWQQSRLTVSHFDEATLKVTAPSILASSAQFAAGQQAIGYPSFTPDSKWLGFHVGDYSSNCVGKCDATTEGVSSLYLQAVSGAPPVKLDQLNDSSPDTADHNLSFEPTFNPLESDGYFWVVFTSTRDWGNQLTGPANNGKKRLWVAAINKQPSATDPSHPAFYLEGQENSMNMRGFWTLAACTASGPASSCTAGFECCSGFCGDNKCIDLGAVACKALGETCATSADCCDSATVICTADLTCGTDIN